ncbi:hypothetical protein B1222_02400 [Paenibacillus larvae subsp. pulvifaciens]|uniref:Uncharacterized protein n=1 Tax=Paenibacillus larvae subsp. pulvifaciens TaxID=1477 RepID=A0A1V0UXT3_9BACL|nr:hypothetical protein B1222_02400 [Paenibacillus larvae subsp. pulvifaciens]ARF70045.1 hypothetical protein B7C51_22620 [Paenibacillus larvae subsp. pulvifaciens]MBH0343312.1 hypothetical protein [Paenibacillus larvae]
MIVINDRYKILHDPNVVETVPDSIRNDSIFNIMSPIIVSIELLQKCSYSKSGSDFQDFKPVRIERRVVKWIQIKNQKK